MALDATSSAHLSAEAPEGCEIAIDEASLGEVRRTEEGYLEAPALITKTGVFEYLVSDGAEEATRIERHLRLPEEVFAPDSLASFERKPVTRGHPWFKRVDASTWRDAAVGIADQVRPHDDGLHVAARMLIQDARTIEAIDAGERQVSCAYYFKREPIPDGKWTDTDGVLGTKGAVILADLIQREIRGNHHAIVTAGRAGPTAAIRLDSADIISEPARLGEDQDMKPEEVQALIDKAMKAKEEQHQAQLKMAQDAADKAASALASTAAERDQLKLAQDAADKAAAAARVKAMVDLHAERLGAVGEAGQTVRDVLLAMDELALKARVITAMTGHPPAQTSAAYLDAAYDTAMRLAERAGGPPPSSVAAGAIAIGAGSVPGTAPLSMDAQAKKVADGRAAYDAMVKGAWNAQAKS